MDDIRQHKVTNKYTNNGRYFVYFSIAFRGKKTIPRANYNWLMENPQFEDVPPGYCLHHLDLDETNDDVTNLGLMKLNHHRAYHGKQNNGKEGERVKLRPPIQIGTNPTKPRIYTMKKNGEVWIKTQCGMGQSRKIQRKNQ